MPSLTNPQPFRDQAAVKSTSQKISTSEENHVVCESLKREAEGIDIAFEYARLQQRLSMPQLQAQYVPQQGSTGYWYGY
ncbi:hypothetical protein Tco_0880481 [Tanacetum coccineum]